MAGLQVAAEIAAAMHYLHFAGFQRKDLNYGIVIIGDSLVGHEQHGLASGQDLWPAMRGFVSFSGIGDSLWRPSRSRHARKTSASAAAQRRDNIVVFAPGRTAPIGGTAQGNHGAAPGRDLFHFSFGEEADPLTVGREERVAGSLGAGEQRS